MFSENLQPPPLPKPESLPVMDLDKTKIIERAKQLGNSLYQNGFGHTDSYAELVYAIVDPNTGQMKPDSEIDMEYLTRIVDKVTIATPLPENVPGTPLTLIDLPSDTTAINPDQVVEVNNYEIALQDRITTEPVKLSAREVSKQYYAKERQSLAEEIKRERKVNRELLADIHVRSIDLTIDLNLAQVDKEEAKQILINLDRERAEVANSLADRIKNFVTEKTGLSFRSDDERESLLSIAEADLVSKQEQQATVEAELEILKELIESDNTRQLIKDKLSEHYQKSEKGAEYLYDKDQRGVEQIMKRTNAFIVHMILTSEELRHNDNSNVAAHTKLADDVDILLSLEPSVSTSSVVPGVASRLWGGGLGTLITGGEVKAASVQDLGSEATGIKHRSVNSADIVSAERADEIISDREDSVGYNEVIIDEPKVAGFFTFSTKPNEKNQVEFGPGSVVKKALSLAAERGVPMFVMSDERRVYELVSFDEVNSIGNIGHEVSPQDLARMPAGISKENRIVTGQRVLENIPFTKLSFHKEASEILNNLGARLEIDMGKKELLEAIKINPNLVDDSENFPKEYLSDIDFVSGLSEYNAFGAYRAASPELQNNVKFIAKIYPNVAIQENILINRLLPEALLQPEVQLLAIKYEKLPSLNTYIRLEMLDNDSVREALLEKISLVWSNREITNPGGEFVDSQISPVIERLLNEFGLIDYLNANNNRFKFQLEKDGILAVNIEEVVV